MDYKTRRTRVMEAMPQGSPGIILFRQSAGSFAGRGLSVLGQPQFLLSDRFGSGSDDIGAD